MTDTIQSCGAPIGMAGARRCARPLTDGRCMEHGQRSYPVSAGPHGGATLTIADDGIRELRLSKSWLATFGKCPESARRSLMTDAPEPPTTLASVHGSLVHRGIEECLGFLHTRGLEAGVAEIVSPEGLSPLVSDAMRSSLLEDFGPTLCDSDKRKNAPASIVGGAAIGVRRWVAEVLPDVIRSAQGVPPSEWLIEERQERLLTTVGATRILLRGTPDLIAGPSAWDHKTGRVVEHWRSDRYDLQPEVYLFLADLDVAESVFYYGYIPRNAADVEIHQVTRAPEHIGWLAEMGRHVIELIDAGLSQWPMSSTDWHCSERWCSAMAAGECRGSLLSIRPGHPVSPRSEVAVTAGEST